MSFFDFIRWLSNDEPIAAIAFPYGWRRRVLSRLRRFVGLKRCRAGPDYIGQRRTVDVVHHDVVLAGCASNSKDRYYMRLAESCCSTGFEAEARKLFACGQQVSAEKFKGYSSIK